MGNEMPVYLIEIAEGTHEAVENQTLLEITLLRQLRKER